MRLRNFSKIFKQLHLMRQSLFKVNTYSLYSSGLRNIGWKSITENLYSVTETGTLSFSPQSQQTASYRSICRLFVVLNTFYLCIALRKTSIALQNCNLKITVTKELRTNISAYVRGRDKNFCTKCKKQ